MGKREPQIIPQKRRARHSPRAWVRGEFTAKSSGWDENRVFLEGDKLEVAVKTAVGCSRTCLRARDRRPNLLRCYFPDD
jgi:hypothetical protein